MKTQSIIAAIAALSTSTLAAPAAPAAKSNSEPPFLIQAIKPGYKFHSKYVHANQNSFWLNKPTSSSCNAKDCPPSKETVFGGGLVTLDLDVDVPGGQAVYVNLASSESGLVSFNRAHAYSEGTITYLGFAFDEEGNFVYNGRDLLACEDSLDPGVYRIFGDVGEPIKPDCVSFKAKPVQPKGAGAGAWQYV